MEDTSETKPVTDTAPSDPQQGASVADEAAETRAQVENAATEAAARSHGDDEGDESDAGEETSAESAGEPGDPAQKRKRRRRRKRKGAPVEGAAEGAHATPHEPSDLKKRDSSNAPFARFFAQHGKRHAFAVGEEVAGRVTTVADGAISIDLFGKAVAFADENEPRDIPLLPIKVDASPVVAADATPVEPTAVADVTEVNAPVETSPDAAAAAGAEHDEATQSAIDAVMAEAEDAEESDTSAGAVEAPELPADPEPLPVLEPPKLGQIFKGRIGAVAESGHIAILNRIIDAPAARARVERYRQERRRVRGLVYGFNRGGFDVLVEGLRAFCPVRGMSLGDIDDPNLFIAQNVEFSLPPARPGTRVRDIIVSRRTILEKQQRKAARDLVRSLQPGQRISGRVMQVREFGAFIDIGGIEGLLHQSEISHSRSVRPEDVLKIGEVVEVQVIDVVVEPKRERRARISLSMKSLLADPWDELREVLADGAVSVGKVTTLTDFGAFIAIAPGIEGLLHISEIGRDLKHASQALNIGDEVHVLVERADRKTRRISLSKLSASEFAEHQEAKLSGGGAAPKSLRQGETVKVKVEKVEPGGILVRVSGVLGRRGRGYLPGAETGKERGADLRKQFPVGTELEVKIVGEDRDGGLRCSLKALAVDEERKAIKDYRKAAAKQGFGTFGDLLRAKLDSSSK